MSSPHPFHGGVAVITGAAGGIGRGVARAAAAQGMRLVLADIAAGPLQAIADELTATGAQVLAVPTDVADPGALDRLADAAFERFGAVRLLVNNAGIEMLGASWELSAEQWKRAMDINVLGPVNGVRAFAPRMIADTNPSTIVNVASIGALVQRAGQTPYIMSKHATLSFTECLFLEMKEAAPHIQVAAVLPGPVATRIFADAPGGDNPATVDQQRSDMSTIVAEGLDPDEAGRMILEQAAAGRFWIATHPEGLRTAADRRIAFLTGLGDPSTPGPFKT
jgi:NAD(P)-dependent dehydrogenase (short-subunit alcohol dehydrogenase family)